ncbi:MAG TPA: PP0621 family protein [Rhodocyclaceae bacterium]|nr:PP0621 family protein [Rhodocyclaceae bacterium]
MVRFLLLLLAVVALIFILSRSSARRKKSATPPVPAPSSPLDAMRRCAHCGVYFPSSESLREADLDYCCDEHRQRGPLSLP